MKELTIAQINALRDVNEGFVPDGRPLRALLRLKLAEPGKSKPYKLTAKGRRRLKATGG